MPDGGRDATSINATGEGYIVFQVKFARDPSRIEDPTAWLTAALERELPKVNKLIERGASEYVLITNVSGTSHLTGGRIDTLDRVLTAQLSIPAMCWWRDDLDRRLDDSFDIKLRYPSLLAGVDLLRLLVQQGAGTGSPLESTALRTYLAAQFEQEKTVKFKQAELSATSLFDIFIDVPIELVTPRKRVNRDVKVTNDLADAFGRIGEREADRLAEQIGDNGQPSEGEHQLPRVLYDRNGILVRNPGKGDYRLISIGAADLLLDDELRRKHRLVVLEGAPGQGKSTLTQYLAQINRARLLGGRYAISIPESHSVTPVAVPLRLELRDLAQWLNGIDPWAEDQHEHKMRRSLETAIVGHVRNLAGGVEFSVESLHRVIAAAPVLLLLDGLDEVANISERHRAVEEVLAAIARLESIAKQLNVLVTSRPTVVPGTPTFPEDRFLFLKLTAIDKSLALAYTDKWADARRLGDIDRAEVRRILADKLAAPHMAELAKNTMQLSILLSLIYLRGSSLPDKRTELYDTYVETFLNRESEKSAVVRKNRRLLIEIHRYVAFYMHAAAEDSRSSGRIRVDELRKIVTSYLQRENRSIELVDELVIGAVERIVALVSRVEGTYEFEVQPLREYFAARYLYDTAPYSPAGRPRRGTKPERFDGLASNPYWMNVARFFAGCFSQGELLDLATRVCELVATNDFRLSIYGRSLAIAFLQDWVFAQSVKATSLVVKSVFDDLGIRFFGGSGPMRGLQHPVDDRFRLSAGSGGEILVGLLWEALRNENGRTEFADAVCVLLMRHSRAQEMGDLWLVEARRRRGERLEGWFRIGRFLGAFQEADPVEIEKRATSSRARSTRYLNCVIRGSGNIEAFSDSTRKRAMLGALSFPGSVDHWTRGATSHFLELVSPYAWMAVVQGSGHWYVHQSSYSELVPYEGSLGDISREILALATDMPIRVASFSEVVRLLEERFGKNWTAIEIALISGAMRDPSERGKGARSLFDGTYPLTSRVRFAKRRPKDGAWWIGQATEAKAALDRAFWLAATYIWADPVVVESALDRIDEVVRTLPPDLRTAVALTCRRASHYSERAVRELDIPFVRLLDETFHQRTKALLCKRIPPQDVHLVSSIFTDLSEPWLASTYLWIVTRLWSEGKISTDEFIPIAERAHRAGGRSDFEGLRGSLIARRMKEDYRRLLERPRDLPEGLLFGALQVSAHMKKPRPLLPIAKDEGWL
jgi:hypothetical protein